MIIFAIESYRFWVGTRFDGEIYNSFFVSNYGGKIAYTQFLSNRIEIVI